MDVPQLSLEAARQILEENITENLAHKGYTNDLPAKDVVVYYGYPVPLDALTAAHEQIMEEENIGLYDVAVLRLFTTISTKLGDVLPFNSLGMIRTFIPDSLRAADRRFGDEDERWCCVYPLFFAYSVRNEYIDLEESRIMKETLLGMFDVPDWGLGEPRWFIGGKTYIDHHRSNSLRTKTLQVALDMVAEAESSQKEVTHDN